PPPLAHNSPIHTAPATTALYTLSLHDALPICQHAVRVRIPLLVRVRFQVRGAVTASLARGPDGGPLRSAGRRPGDSGGTPPSARDRKSTRLNSSHVKISYAVFCLKKKKSGDTQDPGARDDVDGPIRGQVMGDGLVGLRGNQQQVERADQQPEFGDHARRNEQRRRE